TNGQLYAVGLYYSNGIAVAGGNYSGEGSYNVSNLAPGNYYVAFSTVYSGATSTYVLTYSSYTSSGVTNDAEENNTKESANVLPLNGEKTGHIGYYDNAVWDAADWYALTTNSDGDLTLRLQETTAWVDLTIFDNDGISALVNGTIESAYNDSTVVKGLAPGTYYVKIKPHYPNGYSTYKIENVLSLPVQTNDTEPNNTPYQATFLTLNTTVEGHNGYYYNLTRDYEDWYSITTPAGGKLSLTLTPHAGNAMTIKLMRNDGTSVITSSISAPAFTLVQDGLEQGTYFIQLTTSNYYPYTGYNPYTLTNTFEAYTLPNDAFANDYAAGAVTLIANDTVYGHVGFVGNTGTDYGDWWKLNYTSNGNLNLDIYSEPSLTTGLPAWFRVLIYDDTLSTPLLNALYNGVASVNYTTLGQGIYYIKIEPNYAYPFIGPHHAYRIINTFEEINLAEAVSFTASAGKGCNNNKIQLMCSGSEAPYQVQLFRFGNLYGDVISIPDTNLFTIENLEPGLYTAKIKGDGASELAATETEEITVVPKPKNTEVINITADAATLDWDALPMCLDGYKIQWSQTGSGVWNSNIVNAMFSEYTFNGLLPNTSYECLISSIVLADDASAVGESKKVKRTFTTSPLKVRANDTISSASVYPNPASDKVFISGYNFTDAYIQLTINDMSGKTLIAENRTAGQLLSEGIDITPLPSGIYFLNITYGGQIMVWEKFSVIR
ncbi:MAG: T9SS type A sorting domain-containing protein, partial [Chitinophagales bacterium]